MKKLLLCILSCGILITTQVKAETILYCQDELATGFHKKDGSWTAASFKKKRHTIKFNDSFTILKGLYNDNYGPMECTAPFDAKPYFLVCADNWGPLTVFTYNQTTRRYVTTQLSGSGYTDIQDNPDTESLYAGTCTSF
jgi:hypothetical protein